MEITLYCTVVWWCTLGVDGWVFEGFGSFHLHYQVQLVEVKRGVCRICWLSWLDDPVDYFWRMLSGACLPNTYSARLQNWEEQRKSVINQLPNREKMSKIRYKPVRDRGKQQTRAESDKMVRYSSLAVAVSNWVRARFLGWPSWSVGRTDGGGSSEGAAGQAWRAVVWVFLFSWY